jgi:Holliday junction resolvase RusA-like endonuclease
MKYLELTIPGRPVPWARAARSNKAGHSYTPAKQKAHRKAVAFELKAEAEASEVGEFKGPVYLQVLFVYGEDPGTWLRLTEIDTMMNLESVMPFDLGEVFHVGRPDLDNLVKQIMEATEDSGVLDGEDGQISIVMAAKVKR